MPSIHLVTGGLGMTVTTLPNWEFDQDIGRAKRAADSGPVIITDDGKRVYVLPSHDFYHGCLAPSSGNGRTTGRRQYRF